MFQKLPVLPFPDFLSSEIQQYIREVTIQSGRVILFADHRSLQGQMGVMPSCAAIQSRADWPGAIIFVKVNEINRASYKPEEHDSLLAHEVTHLQLLAEGWHRILPVGSVSDESREKIRTIENWLTDPEINRRILLKGFDLGPDRNRELEGHIGKLQAMASMQQALGPITTIPSVNVQTGERGMVPANELLASLLKQDIALYVSLLLEPGVSAENKEKLGRTFQELDPAQFAFVEGLLELITTKGYDTPEKYRQTANLCLQTWGVSSDQYQFVPMLQFTPGSHKSWQSEATYTQGDWNP